jgi:hypothetical protein
MRRNGSHVARGRAYKELDDWVLSLPWVVERPDDARSPGVRVYGVDCPPLGRRRIFLLTGLGAHGERDPKGVAGVLPERAARAATDDGWAVREETLPAGHVLVTLRDDTDVEALVLAAYGYAMS